MNIIDRQTATEHGSRHSGPGPSFLRIPGTADEPRGGNEGPDADDGHGRSEHLL